VLSAGIDLIIPNATDDMAVDSCESMSRDGAGSNTSMLGSMFRIEDVCWMGGKYHNVLTKPSAALASSSGY